MAEFASKGVAGTGLGLGIAGTALGVLNGGLGNVLGGYGNVRNGGCCGDELVNRFELRQSELLSNKDMEIAALRAEKYADGVATEAYKSAVDLSNKNDSRINTVIAEFTKEICDLKRDVAVNANEVGCLNQKLNYEIAAVTKGYESAVDLESERRKCGDENLYGYVNATFVPGKLVMPNSNICQGWEDVKVCVQP